MSCEIFREHLALCLYDELEEDEERRLDAHLESCGACRAIQGELRSGLARLCDAGADGAGVADEDWPVDWPADWVERLRDRVDIAPRPARPPSGARSPWWQVAAGLAAGLFLGWLAASGQPAEPERDPAVRRSSFRRAEPPPPAATLGRSGPLAAWLRG